jgi:hypothetical protein
MIFRLFRRQDEVLFFSFFVSEQDGKYGFLIFLSFFFFYGYSFAAFLRQSLQDSFSNPLVIHTIRTLSPFFCPSRQSMRFSMLYVDRHSAGRISGPYLINVTRLIPRQDGKETSADGTGPEETCAGRGGVVGTARDRDASERPDPRGACSAFHGRIPTPPADQTLHGNGCAAS